MNQITEALLDAMVGDGYPGTEIVNDLVTQFERKPTTLLLVAFLQNKAVEYQTENTMRAAYRDLTEAEQSSIDWEGMAKTIRKTFF